MFHHQTVARLIAAPSSIEEKAVAWIDERPDLAEKVGIYRQCEGIFAQLKTTIERGQQLLLLSHGELPTEESPFRLPRGLTLFEDESDLGRGVEFLSDVVVSVSDIRRKLSTLMGHWHESAGAVVDDESAEEAQALERLLTLGIEAAKCALAACSQVMTLAEKPQKTEDNWWSLAMLATELKRYVRTIPDAIDVARIGHLAPLKRQAFRTWA